MGVNVGLVIRDEVMACMFFPLAWFAQQFALTWSYQAQYNEFSFENFYIRSNNPYQGDWQINDGYKI